MKPPQIPAAILALLLSLAAPFAFAQGSNQSAYNQGVRLFNEERYSEALVIFEKVLQERPDFIYARSYLAKCRAAIAKGAAPKQDLEGKVAKIILPEINFSDASLGDVLDYFSKRSSELTGGETAVNFIFTGSAEQKDAPAITLSLRNIPLTEAIRYVSQLSKTTVKYEEHAVLVSPAQAGGPAQAAEPARPESPEPNSGFAEPAKSPFQ